MQNQWFTFGTCIGQAYRKCAEHLFVPSGTSTIIFPPICSWVAGRGLPGTAAMTGWPGGGRKDIGAKIFADLYKGTLFVPSGTSTIRFPPMCSWVTGRGLPGTAARTSAQKSLPICIRAPFLFPQGHRQKDFRRCARGWLEGVSQGWPAARTGWSKMINF